MIPRIARTACILGALVAPTWMTSVSHAKGKLPSIAGIVVKANQRFREFDSLIAALGKANLVNTLDKDGPFTVFAPTDRAFKQLEKELNVELGDIDVNTLTAVLKTHVASGAVFRPERRGELVTLNGQELRFIRSGRFRLTIKDPNNRTSHVIIRSVPACNGVVYVIDTVLLPK